MGDESDFHKAALKVTKRGFVVGVWALVVAVLALGYAIFADYGGVEWSRGVVAEWVEGDPGKAKAGRGDAATFAAEEESTGSDSEAIGSQGDTVESSSDGVREPVYLFGTDWLARPGLPFWTGFWHLGLIGFVWTVFFFGLNALLKKLFKLQVGLAIAWVMETAALGVWLVVAAVAIGDGVGHTVLAVVGALIHFLLWGLVGFALTLWLYPPDPPRAPVG